MDRIRYLRNQICDDQVFQEKVMSTNTNDFEFLGKTKKEKVDALLKRIIPGDSQKIIHSRKKREKIFEYIVDFWERSLLRIP
ncbi:MAG: hypothetical protein Q7R95_09685, partial [bacterium]|nr:hypothetical protein [bacterium]